MGWLPLAIGIAGSLLLSTAMALQWLTIGSVEGRAVYHYAARFSWTMLVPAVAAAIAAAGLLALHRFVRNAWLLLGIWILAATAMHAGLRWHTQHDLESIFISRDANGFYTVTEEHPVQDVLGRFARVRTRSPLHVQSNMPGKALLLYVLKTVTERTDVLPWLLILLSNCGAFLMFLVVRELLASREAALSAAILYLFVPSRLFFFPLMNTLTPVIVLVFALCMIRWLQRGSWQYAWLSGIVLYALILFEPLPLVLGLLFIAIALRAILVGAVPWDRLAIQACAAVATMILVSELVLFTTGFNLLMAFRQIGAHATEFNALEQRPYGLWVRRNLVEFVIGMGLCQAVLWVATPRQGPVAVVAIGLAAVIVVTDLIGINRGEVVRLWTFLACLAQIPAAAAVSDRPLFLWLVLVSTLVPVSIALGMVRFVVPY